MRTVVVSFTVRTDDKTLSKLTTGLSDIILADNSAITVIRPVTIETVDAGSYIYQIRGKHNSERAETTIFHFLLQKPDSWFFRTRGQAEQALVNTLQILPAFRRANWSRISIVGYERSPEECLFIPHQDHTETSSVKVLDIYKGDVFARLGITTPAGLAACNDQFLRSIYKVSTKTIERIDREIAERGWPARIKD